MTVFTGSENDHFCVVRDKEKCSICREAMTRYPFLQWSTHEGVLICGTCCHKIKDGFMADLIQAAAIIEFQNATGYTNHTLVRKLIKQPQKGGINPEDVDEEMNSKFVAIDKAVINMRFDGSIDDNPNPRLSRLSSVLSYLLRIFAGDEGVMYTEIERYRMIVAQGKRRLKGV